MVRAAACGRAWWPWPSSPHPCWEAPRSTANCSPLGLAGAIGASALLVEQNFTDALVALVVLAVVQGSRRQPSAMRGGLAVAALTVGVGATFAAAVLWSIAYGVGPGALWEALYAFRATSLHVISAGHRAAPRRRAQQLVGVGSGLIPVVLVHFATAWRRLLRGEGAPAAVGLMIVAGLPAIALGGSYWVHYLLELVPAAALAAALLSGSATSRHWGAPVLALVVTSAVLSTTVTAVRADRAQASGTSASCAGSRASAATGRWLAASAAPADTVLTVYGDATVVQTSGLRPASPYLWSLPVRVFDRHLNDLTAALSGRHAATWVVITLPPRSWGLDARDQLEQALAAGYQPVGAVCGQRVYLRSGAQRALAPRGAATVAAPARHRAATSAGRAA